LRLQRDINAKMKDEHTRDKYWIFFDGYKVIYNELTSLRKNQWKWSSILSKKLSALCSADWSGDHTSIITCNAHIVMRLAILTFLLCFIFSNLAARHYARGHSPKMGNVYETISIKLLYTIFVMLKPDWACLWWHRRTKAFTSG